MFKEEWEYSRYATPQVLDKEMHSLEGIIKGIVIDNQINSKEVEALLSWCDKHRAVSSKSPFNEIIPVVQTAIEDGVIDEEERKDILWLCRQYTTENNYYSVLTSDMQRLQGLLAGIASDGEITKEELEGLSIWLKQHEDLKSTWPYDEIDAIITCVLSDGIIDDREQTFLLEFCSNFLIDSPDMAFDLPRGGSLSKTGVCAVDPELIFEDRYFCLTGTFHNGTKNDIAFDIKEFGGLIARSVTQNLDYLIVGGKGNNCWAFSCYGRKVEKVMKMRSEGHAVQLVHEFDLWDAMEDLR